MQQRRNKSRAREERAVPEQRVDDQALVRLGHAGAEGAGQAHSPNHDEQAFGAQQREVGRVLDAPEAVGKRIDPLRRVDADRLQAVSALDAKGMEYDAVLVVDEKFVLNIHHPEEQLAAVAPLLCAGITTYSPMRHYKVGPGQKVGVVGLGGLGSAALYHLARRGFRLNGEANLNVLDPEFAAGKKALLAEDWDGAIAVLKSAALRDPRVAISVIDPATLK